MKRFLPILLACSPQLMAQLPAFPGAEGFGSIATGGRGGDVYYVTNLSASGVGSFAFGVQNAPASGRTIVFAVSGHIRLPSGSGGGLTVAKNKITVAGQTAPGDGICFWNNTMNITGNDLVFRNVRWRYGKQVAGGDSVDVSASQRIIFDHCDVMFSTDENMSSFGTAPEHMTFQWSTNAWGLSGHSAGGLWKMKHATVHHSLWANNHTRNPKLIGCDVFDWVNNLTFGWDLGFNLAPEITGGNGYTYRVNIRNSTFSHGGSTSSCIYGGGLNDDGSTKFQLHMADTALDGNNNGLLDVSRTNYQMVSATGYYQTSTAWPQTTLGNPASPVIGQPVTVTPRLTAYKKILSKTGAVRMEIGQRPLRDEITQLCVTRAATLQRGIIADPLELNLSTGTAFASLQSASAPTDSDLDGMPDAWEEALGLDKNTANHNGVLTTPETAASFFPAGSPAGYTRLEEYLHFKSVPHGTVGKNTAASPSFIEIDLRKFTSGFTASPTFTVSGITNGTIQQSGPGNAVVRFTPQIDSSGRGGFLFTVTDSEGASWTQQCCLLISTQPLPRPVTWKGDGTTNNWDTATPNFTSLLGPTPFANGDAVTIDDSGSNSPTIKVVGALAPVSLTVGNASKNFTLQGTGSISSAGRLTKSGSGTLTVSNSGPNSFSGTTLENGTLSLTTANALGTTPISLTGGTLSFSADPPNALAFNGSATLSPSGSRTLNGAWSGSGSIQITNTGSNLLTLGGGMTGFSGDVSLGTSTGSVRLNGNAGSSGAAFDLGSSTASLFTRNGGSIQLGSLAGASGTNLSGASSAATVTTYNIGALETSTTYHGRISNGGQGVTALTKTGSRTLTLTGNSTHSGATAVNSGTLALLGNFGSSPVNVAANATLSGTGTMGGTLTTATGAILSPGADQGAAAGTLTAGSLALNSPTLHFDLSDDPAVGNDRLQATGNITLTGNLNFVFNLTDRTLSPGTYELISTPGTLTASAATLTSNLPTGSRQVLTLEHSPTGSAPGYVRLVVSGTNANLTWTGANGGLWDRQTTAAWSGASPATFFNHDAVTFNDTATTGNVSITQPVAPQSITVNNSSARAYTLTGAPITGTTSLVKSGTGSLTLSLPRYDLLDCAVTTGSASVQVSSSTGLLPGMTVVSRDPTTTFPAGTTVVSVVNPTTVTLSQNATATSTIARLIFETRNTFSGGTILNDGSLTLASNSWEYYSSSFPPPSNPFGLGSGPITLNGGTLTLLGHAVSTLHVSGALPNDLIVPAGKTATLRSVMRGTYLDDIAGLRGSLSGSGTLNLVVNFAYGAVVGDWSGFSGTLNVSRPSSGANDPCFLPGNLQGLPLANVHLDQVTLAYPFTPPVEGITLPLGSLSGTSTAIIAGATSGAAPVIWEIGARNTSTTFDGNFTPYSNAPIGLIKTGAGTWTLTGTGSVNAGITISQGTLAYGNASTDTLGSTGEISVFPNATLEINDGAKLTASSCEVFTNATLRGRGTLEGPLTSSGTLSITAGTLNLVGDANLLGRIGFSSLTDRLAVTGKLALGGDLQLPATGLSTGRKLLIAYTGSLTTDAIAISNIPPAYLARLDTASPGEIAVRLIEQSAYQDWRLIYFGNTTDPAGDPAADPDEDGLTNFEEFENGSHPNGSTPLVLTIASNSPTATFSSLHSTYNTGVLVWDNGGNLTQRAAQRLILDSTLNGGIIHLGLPTNILTLSTGELEFQGSNDITLSGGRLGTLDSAISLMTSGLGTLTLTSPVSGGIGSLSITGTGNVVLNSANTFTGGLTLNGASLKQGVATAFGSANGALQLVTGSIDLNGIATGLGSLSGNGGSITNLSPSPATLTLGNNNATGGNFAGSISGDISLTKTGSGIQVLAGNNPYTGLTTVSAGTLRSGADHAIGNGGLALGGGTLDLQTFSDTVGAVSLNSGTLIGTSGILTASSYSLNSGLVSARIGGASATLAKTGTTYTNTATLSGANTYGGATALGINSGALVLANSSALGDSPSVDVAGNGTAIVLANEVTITGKRITIRGNGTNNGSSAGNFSGSLTTSASAAATWAGSVELGDTNGRLGTGNSGTLHISGPILGSGSNQSISISAGTGTSLGTVILSGTNLFTGNISIVRGSLKLAANQSLPATAIIDVGSASVTENTTFDLNGCHQTLAGLRRTSSNTTQVSTVTNSSANPATLTLNQLSNLTYSGRINGNLTVAKSGSGALTLSNSNALAPSVSLAISQGTLGISSTHTITALSINGLWQPAGTYNSANSSGRITGSGSLVVTTNGPIGFAAWISGFPSLSPSQQAPDADPDQDGVENLLEYVLGGAPDVASPTILPVPSLSSTDFIFTFTRREESASTTTQVFEYGTSLGAWTPEPITNPTVSQVTLGPLTNGNRVVTIRLPRSHAEGGKLFGRLKVTQP